MKSRRMRWAEHLLRMGEKRNTYRILVGEPGSRFCHFTPGYTAYGRGLRGLRAGLVAVVKRKNSCPSQDSNPVIDVVVYP
jgi:hypothetical protein